MKMAPFFLKNVTFQCNEGEETAINVYFSCQLHLNKFNNHNKMFQNCQLFQKMKNIPFRVLFHLCKNYILQSTKNSKQEFSMDFAGKMEF